MSCQEMEKRQPLSPWGEEPSGWQSEAAGEKAAADGG